MKLPWTKKDKPGILSTEFQLPAGIVVFAYKTLPPTDAAWWVWAFWAWALTAFSALAVFYAKYRTQVKGRET